MQKLAAAVVLSLMVMTMNFEGDQKKILRARTNGY